MTTIILFGIDFLRWGFAAYVVSAAVIQGYDSVRMKGMANPKEYEDQRAAWKVIRWTVVIVGAGVGFYNRISN